MTSDNLRKLIERLTPTDGRVDTGINGVQLFRVSHPVKRTPSVYTPSICILVNGSKRTYFGDHAHEYDTDHYFCCTMPYPVEAETRYASKDNPVLGMMLSLETEILSETVLEFEASSTQAYPITENEHIPGLAVVRRDARFDEAIVNLLALEGNKSALAVLGKGRLTEVFYALMISGAGPMVRQTFGGNNSIAKSIQYARENLNESITIEDMASKACMSRAVFFRRFKEATTLTPLQFVKNLKLNTAAKQIATGMGIRQAATQSGYISSSQFSREFKRLFGVPPQKWSDCYSSEENV